MKVAIEAFGMRLKSDWLTASHRCFRPPSWPPPRDWVVSEERDGKVLSRWGDPVWDLSPWAGGACSLNFGDVPGIGRSITIDSRNADLLRLMTTWRIWGSKGAVSTGSVVAFFSYMRTIVGLCSREGILASELMSFPRVLEQLLTLIPPSRFHAAITDLHHLWDARESLGFVLVNDHGIKSLMAASPDHESEQTAYIPPRIWTYQVTRLRECLDDFLGHRQQLEDCFNFCVDAYARNYGSLQIAMTSKPLVARNPFLEPDSENWGARTGCAFHGPFKRTAERFGIRSLLERWVDIPDRGVSLRQLSGYLTLVQYVGLAYIANFTLQRVKEVASLRADCLLWEDDPKLGRVPIIRGETTKTDPDSDARWPTSPSVEVAVAAMNSVARLRMRCAAAHPNIRPTDADLSNPHLFVRTFEPWVASPAKPYTTRTYPQSYSGGIAGNLRLFDPEQLRITDEDLRIARMLTPNLSVRKGFVVGKVWPLGWHQLRRTGAVNMFASGLLSDSSMQLQMKHSSRLMPLYYGRGYTKLHLNEEVEGLVIAAMYEAMARSILAAMGDRFVSPLSGDKKNAIVVNLIGDKDVKQLAQAARRGELFFRETRLGGCTKRGVCSYGGIESVARCAGGDGHKPCTDVLYDRTKASNVENELKQLDQELVRVPACSPRHRALLAERKGLENFLNVVRT